MSWDVRPGLPKGYIHKELDIDVVELMGEWLVYFPRDKNFVRKIEYTKTFEEAVSLIAKIFGIQIAVELKIFAM